MYLVIPGISLFPMAADILEVTILQTATRVPVIAGGDSSPLLRNVWFFSFAIP